MRGPRHPAWAFIPLLVAVHLAGPGLLPAQGPADEAQRRPSRAPVVVDAGGRLVGVVFGLYGVRVQAGDRPAVLSIGQGQFTGGFSQAVFESPDCSGPALLRPLRPPEPTMMLEQVGVGPPTVLLAPAGPLGIRTVRSRWNAALASPLCEAVVQETAVYPAAVLMDLSVFTPPFRVE